ncbi:MAG: 1-deoxy-D-xylulose-5-phosphate reductoisomerase, partial [Armatimonadetes bacterium]|nr:1-deoxy-D-xylulose-5-phosphate reductoisomerase [Armatimonadota bacterium]NIM22988.1 1-deoxy-D-xylulose-5-phosphate reductoisomerase [Armatimonadota bacterium]NIM66859.1 1-deoxy-D-xylulose-5-phosphate reductoisomerase [Armatimonadota bacterium]NIM75399.1 1-deoxy-D-xylulose-5-phosphate reductoisomerase [Armatimonadota bacterium]NIN05046.1 1-deoxy-D-xylulose-5-phosphate reductoisomerase [Armatimonadota bacterium]
MSSVRSAVILGSTGSIGQQALEVISAHPERFRVLGLSAQRNLDLLISQWERFRPPVVGIGEENLASALRERLPAEVKILAGESGLCELASLEEADVVLASISGIAGLMPVLSAVKAGQCIAIANKEPLVVAGELLMTEAARCGATLLPVDSEHSAIFQLLEGRPKESLHRVILTGSGGPFLDSPADLSSVTPQQALAHPTWKMGPKVTVDSATLMNKGLEIIEAHRLFDIGIDDIEVIIHPQSIVHSMVEFVDGAVLAHLAHPDMRIPIQFALGYPERLARTWSSVDLLKAGGLSFLPPNLERFPCLRLAREAAEAGGTATAVMNAANEVAVTRFLAGKIRLTDIPRLVEEALSAHTPISRPSLEQ